MTGLLALCLLLQQEWIDKLRSDRIDDREEAERELRKLGAAAVPDLEKAARDSDPEVAGRARRVLRIFTIEASLTPALVRAIPGLADRVAADEHEWTAALIRASRLRLRSSDLDPLARGALRAAEGEERRQVLKIVRERYLRSALPEIVRCLADAELGDAAFWAIQELGTRDLIPDIAALLDSEQATERCRSVGLLRHFRAKGEAPRLRKLVEDPSEEVRRKVLDALVSFGRAELPALLKLLGDPVADVRRGVVAAIARWRATEALENLFPLLSDGDRDVRRETARTLVDLGARIPLTEALALAAEWLFDALAAVPLSELEPELRKWLDDPRRRLQAIDGLARVGAVDSAGLIDRYRKHSDPHVRKAALRATVKLRRRDAIPAVVEGLDDSEAAIRGEAVKALVALRAHGAADALAKLLDDSVGDTALEALVQLRARGTIPEIAKRLPRLRDAGRALAELKAYETAPKMIAYLGDAEAETRLRALEALRVVASRKDFPAVAKRLADADPRVRAGAARLLGDRRSREHAAEIARLLDDGEEQVRLAAIDATADLGVELDRLRGRVNDPSPLVRLQVAARGRTEDVALLLDDADETVLVQALTVLRDREARHLAPEVAKRLGTLRVAGTVFLGALGSRESVPALVAIVMETGDELLASAGIRALGNLRAFRELQELLRSDDASIRYSAAGALREAGGSGAAPMLLDLLDDPETPVREIAAKLLVDLRERSSRAERLLDDPDPDLRALATAIVPDVGKILPLLRDPEPTVRAAAARALQDRDEAAPRIAKLLRDADSGAREGAAMALGLQKAAEYAPEIAALLRDPEGDVRIAAVRALVALAFPHPDVARLLRDPDKILRQAAVDAVARLGMRECAGDLEALLDDPELCEAALEALHELRCPSARFAEFLEIPRAALAIADLFGREAEPPLRGLLRHPDPDLRSFAMGALARIGRAEAIPAMLGDRDASVRLDALRILARSETGLAEAVKLLELDREDDRVVAILREWENADREVVRLFRHPDSRVRLRALRVLRVPCAEARPLLRDPDPAVRAAAVELFGEPIEDDVTEVRRAGVRFDPERGLSDADPEIRALAASLLESLPKLLEAARDPDRSVRRAAAVPLARLGAREAIPLLLEILAEVPYARDFAVHHLLDLGAKDRASEIAKIAGPHPRLLPLLPDAEVEAWLKDPRYRAAALSELGKRKAPDEAYLADPDPRVRVAAVQGLARWKKAGANVLPLLDDPDYCVIDAARSALIEAKAVERVRPLLETKLAGRAFAMLVEMGAAPDPKPFLGNPEARRHAIELLGEEDLLLLLRDAELRGAAMRELVERRSKKAIPAIAELLAVAELRAVAIRAIAGLGGAIDGKYLQDPDPRVRCAAVRALRSAVPDLDDPDPELRDLALGRSRSPDPRIAKLLRDPRARPAALRALVRLGMRDPGILELLNDRSARAGAVRAIAGLGWTAAAPELRKRLFDSDAHLRRNVILALADLGVVEAAPEIAILLDDEDAYVREAAVDAVGRLGWRDAAPALLRRLREPVEALRRAAAVALGRLGARECAPEIARQLKHVDPVRRGEAALALAGLGVSDGIEDLLADPLPANRCRAIEALALLKQGAPAVRRALADGDGTVRRTAMRALAEMGAREAESDLRARLDGDQGTPAAEAIYLLGWDDVADRVPLWLRNAHRKPNAWRRLRARPSVVARGEPADRALLRFATAAGCAIEGLDAVTAYLEEYGMNGETIDAPTYLDAIREALPSAFDFILEDDRIRIVTADEARAFWSDGRRRTP